MCQLPRLGEKDRAPTAKRESARVLHRRDRHALAHLVVREREVAGRDIAPWLRVEQRLLDCTDLLTLPAARVEPARRRRVGRAWHVATEDLAPALHARARNRHG